MTYLTEAEARTQDCPFFRDHYPAEQGYQGVGRGGPMPERYLHRKCMASACKMAWRWANWHSTSRAVARDPAKGISTFQDISHFVEEETAPNRLGYCGIAGKPE